MFILGANGLKEITDAVINSVRQALNSFKDDEKDAIGLAETINSLKKNLRTTQGCWKRTSWELWRTQTRE